MKNTKLESRYTKDQLLEAEITDIGTDGEGIGKIDGYTLFIKDAVIGDKVRAKIMKAKKNYAYAHLEEVLEKSPFRQEARCPIARQCGGCQLQNMTYERQLEFKQNKVRNNIVRLGGFDGDFIDGIMEPIIGMEEPWRYRNKAQFPIGTGKDGQPVAGFYAGRTHSIIPVSDCLIGTKENEAILDAVLTHMKKYKISAYDETTGQGLMRHVLIRKGFTSGQIMVCLVVNYSDRKKGKGQGDVSSSGENAQGQSDAPSTGKLRSEAGELHAGAGAESSFGAGRESGAELEIFLPGQQKLVEALSEIPGMTSISVSINTEKTNVIMGREVHTIWGKPTITDTLCGLDFEISPLSFYQVNPVQTEKLYGQAIEYAGLTGKETVWDLYCGIGTITLSMAKAAGKVYGVEIIPDAIEDAKRNAERNGITNAKFYCGKAEVVLPEFYNKGSLDASEGCNAASNMAKGGDSGKVESKALHPDVIVVDPPRKGCDEKCLETMLKMSPDRIVYVSCDSATLARDLRILVDGGYELKHIRPCDMFSWSSHVETVVCLSKHSK
jgi:23S rRNA (uracil1939-C5)-methyltransferase